MLRHYDTLSFLAMQFYIAFLSGGLVLAFQGKVSRLLMIGMVSAVSGIFFLIAARLRQNHQHFAEVGERLESQLVAADVRPITCVRSQLRAQRWGLARLPMPVSSLYYSVYFVGLMAGLALLLFG